MIEADHQLAGGPSIFFDAVVVAASTEEALMLEKEAAAIDWIRDAFGHLKVIGVLDSSLGLAEEAGVEEDEGVVEMDAEDIAGSSTRRNTPRVESRTAIAQTEVNDLHGLAAAAWTRDSFSKKELCALRLRG